MADADPYAALGLPIDEAAGLPQDMHVPDSQLPVVPGASDQPSNHAPFTKDAEGNLTFYGPSGDVIGHKTVNSPLEIDVVPDAAPTASPATTPNAQAPADPYASLGVPLGSGADAPSAAMEPETTIAGLEGAATRGLAPVAAGALLGAGAGAFLGGVGAVPGAAVGAAAAGLTQLVGDPLVDRVNSAFGTNFTKPTDAMEHLLTSVGVPEPKTAAERIVHSAASGAGTGLATAGLGSVLAQAPGVLGGIGQVLSAAPAADAASFAGSNAGAQVAHENGAGPVGEIGASLLGGGLGALGAGGAARIGEALGPQMPSELIQSFDRLNVPPMAADVGGHFTRMLTAGTSKLTLGGIPLEQAAQRSVEAARAARSAIADRIGNVMRDTGGIADTTGAGQVAQQGMRNWMVTTEGRASHLYDAVPVPDDMQAALGNTRAALTEMSEGLKSNPQLSKIWAENPRLQHTLDALTPKTVYKDRLLPGGGKGQPIPIKEGGELSWKDLNAFRSIVGKIIGRPSLTTEGDQLASLRKLYGALSEDMRATAKFHSPNSLAKFERANTYFRARQGRIDGALTSILGGDGNLNGEAAFKQIERWSAQGGHAAAVGRALRSMSPDEAASVRATLFDKLGTVTKGRQDENGNVFSPADFATHWNGLSSRAKATLFPGADYRQSIDDLVRVANAQKAATKLGQGSPTAHLLQAGQVAGHAGAFALSVFTNPLHALAIAGGAGGELATGRLLASPRFARWLASAPMRSNPAARLAHINRLTAIATAEPAIANEVLNLQQRLASAFTAQPIAAQPSGPTIGEKPDDAR